MADIFDSSLVETRHTDYYLQAFLYASLIRHGATTMSQVNPACLPVAPALLFIRNAQKSGYTPILQFAGEKRGTRVPINDIADYHNEFIDALKNLLSEIFNPDMPFIPTPQSERCLTCPYHKICGV